MDCFEWSHCLFSNSKINIDILLIEFHTPIISSTNVVRRNWTLICFDCVTCFRIDQCHQESCEQVNSVSEMTVQRLLLELETGGNVRFEDGKPSDPWYSYFNNVMWMRL